MHLPIIATVQAPAPVDLSALDGWLVEHLLPGAAIVVMLIAMWGMLSFDFDGAMGKLKKVLGLIAAAAALVGGGLAMVWDISGAIFPG